MAEFKIGDKVRRTVPSEEPDLFGYMDTVYDVIAVDEKTGQITMEGPMGEELHPHMDRVGHA